jgi:hypothetical protein
VSCIHFAQIPPIVLGDNASNTVFFMNLKTGNYHKQTATVLSDNTELYLKKHKHSGVCSGFILMLCVFHIF